MFLISGKIYTILDRLDFIPIESFDNFDYLSSLLCEPVFTVDEKTKPNIFLFIEPTSDAIGIRYLKILYKNKIYITLNEYHLKDKIKLL